MITAVGHGDLTPETLRAVERELTARLERIEDPAPGLVRTGAGPAAAFGRAVRATGRRLVVLLPAQGSVPAPLVPADVEPTRELLALAQEVRLMAYEPGDRHSRITADEALISASARLLAVWDGSPSDGRDATAHLVAYARARGIPVEVVWPVGAARGAIRQRTSPDPRPAPTTQEDLDDQPAV
ncbi:hypothetical protein [Streptomyces vilmorinianum]|uniref:hypothetical protein n=1 Tax=Streptomyces vilmorinianum TaxID=3051092 RepID=UPI0010FB8D8F|nr:hypothetical protein [Streptomyces vilmorinianum]